jgi:hypothetical protein
LPVVSSTEPYDSIAMPVIERLHEKKRTAGEAPGRAVTVMS